MKCIWSSSSPSPLLQVMGWVPRLCQRGDGRLSRGSGGRLGISPPGVQKDAVLRKSLRHVLQPQQPPGSLGLPARITRPGRDQPGVSTRACRSPAVLPPPSPVSSAAAAAVLDITTRRRRYKLCVFKSIDFSLFFSALSEVEYFQLHV